MQEMQYLINQLNNCFGETVLNGWALNALCRERKSTDYFGKALSGTSEESLERT